MNYGTYLFVELRRDVSPCTDSNLDFSTTWGSHRWCCLRRRTDRAWSRLYPGIHAQTGFDPVYCAALRHHDGRRAEGRRAPPAAARSKKGSSAPTTGRDASPATGTSGRWWLPYAWPLQPSRRTPKALIVDKRYGHQPVTMANRFRHAPADGALIGEAWSRSKSNRSRRRPPSPASPKRPKIDGDCGPTSSPLLTLSSSGDLCAERATEAIADLLEGGFLAFHAHTEFDIRKRFSKGAPNRSCEYNIRTSSGGWRIVRFAPEIKHRKRQKLGEIREKTDNGWRNVLKIRFEAFFKLVHFSRHRSWKLIYWNTRVLYVNTHWDLWELSGRGMIWKRNFKVLF